MQCTPYETILAREARNRMEHAKWIAFFHKNPVEELEFLDMQVFLRKTCRMKLFEYDHKVIRKALEGTKFEPALILFQSETYFGVADDLKVTELVQNLRKLPRIVLIGKKKKFLISECFFFLLILKKFFRWNDRR